MSCKVKLNRHGFLALRIFWRGVRFWEGSGLRDTPENRRLVEAKALLINAEIATGTFDYPRHFPNGNKTAMLKPAADTRSFNVEMPKTVGEYYRIWIERKKPPLIRAGLARDYRDHFKRYILPKFESTPWADVTPAMLDRFRGYLLADKGLALKSAKNIINASFRACYRDARKIDRLAALLQSNNPFADITWPRTRPNDPDPFSEDERDKILKYFREKIEHYYPFALTQFLTGMRPSEALALRWADVDFERCEIDISKSRYIEDGGATKTAGSVRVIKLVPQLAGELQALFHRTPRRLDDNGRGHVFLNEEGKPIDFHTWRGKASGRAKKAGEKTPHGVWYRALRGAGVRPRGPYHTRHTFISIGVSYGANIKWLADYCGTSPDMIQKHYGKYIRADIDEQLERVLGRQGETLVKPLEREESVREKVAGKSGKSWWAHLDSNQNPEKNPRSRKK